MHDRLDSWKEIAQHLGTSVRTVQRWEKTEGLPIRRHQHDSGASIFASRADIDAWRDGRAPRTRSGRPAPLPPLRKAPIQSEDRWQSELEEIRALLPDFLARSRARANEVVPIGRGRELEQWRAFQAETSGEAARMVCLAGEAGIGKTTLLDTFEAQNGRVSGGGLCARAGCSERLEGSEAYLPLLDALHYLIEGNEPLRRLLRLVAPTWYLNVSPLWAREDEGLASIVEEASGASGERLKRDLAAFFRELGRLRPVLLVIDDIHWADASTVECLAYLARHPEMKGLLIVTTYRRAELLVNEHAFLSVKRDLQERGLCREVNVGFLAVEDVRAYVDQRYGDHTFPDGLAASIHAQTEGSPLFMVGLIDELERNNKIVLEGESWQLLAELDTMTRDLPQSVRGMIERTIHRLVEADRRLLEVASVQGASFDSAVLAGATDSVPDEVERRLHALESLHGMIRRIDGAERGGSELTEHYEFVHILYQNVLYDSLPPTVRARTALRVANALLSAYPPGRVSLAAAALGILFETARRFDLASDRFLEASRRAGQHSANGEAAALALRAIENAEKLEGVDRWTRVFDSATHKADLDFRLTHFASARDSYSLADRAAEELGDPIKRVDALCGASNAWFYQREVSTAREVGTQALAIATASDDPVAIAVAEAVLARDALWSGDLDRADTLYSGAIPALLGDHGTVRALEPMAFSILMYGWRCEWEKASQATQKWLERATDRSVASSQMHFFRGMSLGNQGFFSDAISVLREGRRIAEINDDAYYIGRLPNTEAWLLRELGDHEGAMRLNLESVEMLAPRVFTRSLKRMPGSTSPSCISISASSMRPTRT